MEVAAAPVKFFESEVEFADTAEVEAALGAPETELLSAALSVVTLPAVTSADERLLDSSSRFSSCSMRSSSQSYRFARGSGASGFVGAFFEAGAFLPS